MNIVIVLPTFNEKDNIQKIVTILEEEIFPQIKYHKMFILVADDKSPDGTADTVKKLMKKWSNISLSSGDRHGLGAAYIRGMTYAIEKMGADVLFEMDADLQHDPQKIPQFVKKIDEGYDIVIGTRYSDGGSIPQNWPFQRKVFSTVANLFVRTVFMIFFVHDWTGGYRALTKEVFLKERMELKQYRGYIFQISMLHKVVRDGFKLAEVPFHFSDRELGRSKIAPVGYIFDVVKFVLVTRVIELKRFIKFLFVGGTGFIVQILLQEGTYHLGIATFLAVIAYPLVHAFTHSTHVVALTNGIAAGIGAEGAILSNFTLNNLWTFKDRAHKSFFHTLGRGLTFNITSFGAVIIQSIAIFLGVFLFGENLTIFSYHVPTRVLILFPTIIFLVVPVNYLVYNKIIWKTKHDKKIEK